MTRTVVVNPASASGRTAKRWERIVAALETGGERFDVQLTACPGDATTIVRRAVEAGTREFVVLGGDGTIGEVVAGFVLPDGSGPAADGIELSVIHQGTGGDLARGLGIPKDEDGAVATALDGAPRPMDLGVVHFATEQGPAVRAFASTSNVGMAAEVVQRVTGPLKRLGNNGAFAVATVGCLTRNKRRSVRIVTAEGLDTTADIVDIDVCNNPYMGGGMHVAPDARLDDGLLDVVVIGAASRTKLIRTFPKIYSGRHVDSPLVRIERTRSVTIESLPGHAPEGVVLDGELLGTLPARFEVLAGAIAVRVPASSAQG